MTFFVQEKERDWCFLLADELDSQIARLVKSRPLLGKFPPYLVDPIVLFTLGAAALLYLVFLGSRLSPTRTPEQIQAMSVEDRTRELLQLAVKKHSQADWIMPITWVVMALVIAVLGLRPISRLLEKSSRSCFYWSDVVPIHDAFEKRVQRIKWGVAVAFIVSLLATLVGHLMTR